MQRGVGNHSFTAVKVKRVQRRRSSLHANNEIIQSSNTIRSTNNKLSNFQAKLFPAISSEMNDSYELNESKIVPNIKKDSIVSSQKSPSHSFKNQAKSSNVRRQHSPRLHTVTHSSISSTIDIDHQELQAKHLNNTKKSSITTQTGVQHSLQPHVMDTSLSRNVSTYEGPKEKEKRRQRRKGFFGWLCCCPCPCCFLCIIGALLLATAIVAILIALLIKPNTTTTTSIVITAMTTATTTSITTITTSMTTATTTSMTTATTTSITTTTTVSIPQTLTRLVSSNDTVVGIWNTTAGGDSTPSTGGTNTGNYYGSEIPKYAFDSNTNTKYTSFGYCNSSTSTDRGCGVNTGLYVTSLTDASLLLGIQFCTGNDQSTRDPITVTVEGSNSTSSILKFGSSWTLIYNGSTGLGTDPGRQACGSIKYILSNYIAYLSYRILITSQRAFDEATQYSELRLLG